MRSADKILGSLEFISIILKVFNSSGDAPFPFIRDTKLTGYFPTRRAAEDESRKMQIQINSFIHLC